jgi:hypothetical protein
MLVDISADPRFDEMRYLIADYQDVTEHKVLFKHWINNNRDFGWVDTCTTLEQARPWVRQKLRSKEMVFSGALP